MIKNIVSTIKETFNLRNHHKVSSIHKCCYYKKNECLCEHDEAGHSQNHKRR